MSQKNSPEFGKIRAFFWPIHQHELKKLLPLLVIFFLISLNYNTLRCMKDSLVVTAKNSGAEVIPFIKVWVMFPMAVAMTFLFTKLSNRLPKEQVFYIMISLFLGFFAVFAFLLYPYRDQLHANQLADYLQLHLPSGFKGLTAMCRYWIFTSFYVMSELWGSIILFLLFWAFANSITKVTEAKRFYGLFGIGANAAGVAAGAASMFLSRNPYARSLPVGVDSDHQWIILQLSMVLLAGLASIFVFRWLHTNVLVDPRYLDASVTAKEKAFKGKLSLRECFSYLTQSRYLLCIAAIVVSYNLVINLVEVVWKNEVRQLYPDKEEYNTYMNQVMIAIGMIATFTALCVSGNVIRWFGWTTTALITPYVLLLTSVAFFGCFFAKNFEVPILTALIGGVPQAMIVFLGSAQNVLSRAAKYTVYDATKELAFVPLSEECKLKGKAVIDGVGSRLGKSGGSAIHQVLLVSCSTITASSPYVALILFLSIAIWFVATRILGTQFKELTEEHEVLVQQQETDELLLADGARTKQAV